MYTDICINIPVRSVITRCVSLGLGDVVLHDSLLVLKNSGGFEGKLRYADE